MGWQAVETIPLTIGAPVDAERAAAVRVALLQRAVPLARLVDGRLEPLATAMLIASNGCFALLTAAHVFDEVRLGDLAVPLPRQHRVVALASARARIVVHPQRDLALMWIADAALGRLLADNWLSCPLAHWLQSQPQPSLMFVIAGYPGANARRIDGRVYAKPVVIFTGAIDSDRYAYARTAMRVDGVEIHTPELDGVSGATVWSVSASDDGNPAACILTPTAVQVAFLHSRHLRAEPIADALSLLRH